MGVHRLLRAVALVRSAFVLYKKCIGLKTTKTNSVRYLETDTLREIVVVVLDFEAKIACIQINAQIGFDQRAFEFNSETDIIRGTPGRRTEINQGCGPPGDSAKASIESKTVLVLVIFCT